jgi:hypothetical protein
LRLRTLWLALWLLGACGYDVIELAPEAPGVEVLVVGNVPASAVARFRTSTGGKSDPKRLAWAYPDDALAVPANVAPLTFQWKVDKPDKKPDAKESDVYELRLTSGASELSVYTTDTSFALDPARWLRLLTASLDGAITCALRALATGKAGELLDGSTRTLSVRGALPAGSLYFESGAGIARTRIADSAATPLALAEPSSGALCGEGLSISADGSRLSTACSAASGGVWTLPALGPVRTILPDPARSGAGSLDNSGARSAEARTNELVVLDAASGAVLQTVASLHASAPDWSPDGRAIVFVLSEPAAPMMMTASGPAPGRESTSIARVEQLADGSWSSPVVVVAASADTGPVLRAPRYSPDGSWIAFAGADAPADEVSDVRLFVVRALGGAPVPVGGVAAPGPMMKNDLRGSGSAPSWLPGDRPDRAWLVFSSTRDVGAQKPAPMLRQLWISAVDLLPQEPGIDVARAALWLPGQSATSDNRHASFAPALPKQ